MFHPASQHQSVNAPILKSRTKRQLSRREFTTILATISVLPLAGCNEYRGIGPDPDGKESAVSAGAFGFTVDWYGDGTFRLNADFRKVLLYGMFATGSIALPALMAGQVALTLIDNINNESFVLACASESVTAIGTNALLGRFGDFQVDVTQFRKSRNTQKFGLTGNRSTDLVTGSSVTQRSAINGTWKGYAPNGRGFTYDFATPTYNSMEIRSAKLDGPASFGFTQSSQGGAMIFSGTVRGTFSEDKSGQVRSSSMKLLVINENVIQAETYYIAIDSNGNEVSRRWWPFQLRRV